MADENFPRVLLETSKGNITLELNKEKAPITVKNFLGYVKDGYYDGLVFHRVIKDFMIQGGGLDANLQPKKTKFAIKNEAQNGLKNVRGSVAMARTALVDSATSQFFINTVDNPFLDNKGKRQDDFGYCVFGKVVEGFEVVDEIRQVKTGSLHGHSDVPLEPITIVSAKILE
ncbi:peptidylprolyl isomerase [Trichlorobacter ammonificans]|uniref:Peptidyl-prolyl cis-trans isomerase n=1 Tax=Trichlorobacter ammonificans TaxID=2916410 RepID=A0ABM9D5J3_9BACT|nr:peptidylprolyl isomerase [Trichlorobacter ammonificans]CAH2030472.1 peptidyl-prolyl cis-trans isomerase A [Trichlorobacter ammonificans]